MTLTVRPVESEEAWNEARMIRTRVFIDEQACPPELEWDAYEATSRHLVGYVDAEPIAAARWRATTYNDAMAAKLERFAVLKEHRGHGYGREMVRLTMDDARRAGLSTFVLHAQAHLEPFYRSFGFEPIGEPFEEAGIPHVKMAKSEEGRREGARRGDGK